MPSFGLDSDGEEGVSPSPQARSKARCIAAILVLTILGCSVLMLDKKEEEAAALHEIRGEIKSKVNNSGVGRGCSEFCKARLNQRQNHHGGDFLSNSDLILLVQESRTKIVDDLKVKYGEEYFSKIFEPSEGKPRQTFVGATKDGPSMSRFQRKLQMKVLQVQAAIHQENTELLQGCDCNGNVTEGSTRRLQRESGKVVALPPLESYFSHFVWASGGHSASAGHGNLHNESYTAYMENAAKPAFDAIGIEFEGRNYGMGSMQSAPLLSLCNEAVYGTDADVLSWDFGMTDNTHFFIKALHSNRAGIHRNRPAIFDVTVMGQSLKQRVDGLKIVEGNGLTTLCMEENLHMTIMKEIPDMFGMNQEQMDAIPEFIRHFKCEGKTENGDPTCADEKYNNKICAKRKHQAGWHPGWRVHALFGNMMGLFLIDTLMAAIDNLGSDSYDPKAKLEGLKKEEDKDYEMFLSSTIPLESPSVAGFFNASISSQIDPMVFFRDHVLCRTSLLPAESRYKGYVSEEQPLAHDEYDKGIARNIIDKLPANGKLRIAYDRELRQEWCPTTLMIDFKDYFYVSQNDGLVSTIFPNNAELEAYSPWEPKGVLIICFMQCSWEKCPPGDHRLAAVNEQRLKIKINNVIVTKMLEIKDESFDQCGVAEGPNGLYFERNQLGRYNISVKVEPVSKELGYTRITAIMAL